MLETLVFFPLLAALRGAFAAVLAALGALLSASDPAQATPVQATAATQEPHAATPAAQPALLPYRFEPAPGRPAVEVPRDEYLGYQVQIEIAFVKTTVGRVVQTCRVEPERASVLLPAQGESASIQLDAKGSAMGWGVHSIIETRLRGRDWPRITYAASSVGSETRRREVLVGLRDGEPTSSYRSDTEKGAPAGTRIWRPAELREVPEGTVDMLSAILLARHLVREDVDRLTFPLIDKDRIWALELTRGPTARMKTPAGTFDVVEVVLSPRPYPGETFAKKQGRFEGVFGIRGSIHLWVDRRTGVTVRIQGDLPVGPIELGIDVVLDSYRGTPSAFVPVE
jgi:hypothetical protein